MKVDKGDLDNQVVEDGEAAVILKADSETVTSKNRAAVKATSDTPLPISRRKMTGQEKSQQNGTVSVATRERVPVEDSEEDDCNKENGGEDVDNLTDSLKGCSIQETAKLGIEEQLAQLAVKDKDEGEEEDEDNTQCNSLQSQSSIIAIDPPSLPHEEEEEKGEAAEDLAPRGPTAGKPAGFRPNNQNYNHIASKAYGSHNLDPFYHQAGLSSSQHPRAMNGFSQNSFSQNGLSQVPYYNMAPQMNGGMGQVYNNVPLTSGKRGMDDDDENAFKYTRPGQEENMGYVGGLNYMNDLSGGMKKTAIISHSQHHGCGGQVIDNSPEILPPSVKPFEELQREISMSDVESMLEVINAQESHFDGATGVQAPIQQTQYGQVSNSFQPEFDFGTQMTQTDKVGSSTRNDYDPGYSSENSPRSETVGSPGSSPKPSFSPMRPPSNMSQDSGIASPFSHGVPSPPEDVSHNRTWVPDERTNSPYSVNDNSQSALYMSPHSAAMSPYSTAMSPASTAMSPPSTINLDDLTLTSALSPIAATGTSNDTIFDGRKEELKDALEIIGKDLEEMNKKRVSHHTSSHKTIESAQADSHPIPVPVSCGGMTPNVPASVMVQQQTDRPDKLPIPPLVRTQRPHPPSVMPVMVVPTTANCVTTAAPVTSSQPVLLMPQPQGQAPSLIVVVNSSQAAPAQQASKKKQPVPIRPRPGPAIAPSSSPPTPKNDPSVPKSEPRVSSPRQQVLANGVAVSQNGVAPVVCGQPPVAAPSGSGKKSRNPQQPKMLNIARRLVASMTTNDLSFQDAEGDTYLHVSVCKADCNMVQALLERMSREKLHSLINTQNNMRQTSLYLAVSSNAPEMVELLIRYNADVNLFAEHTTADGRTKEVKAALHCAASNGDQYLATLQALLAARELNIDQVNSDGHTALHCAILEHGKPCSDGGIINNLPIIQALIKHGADPNAQGKKSGKTALMYALESRDINLIENIVALIDPARLRTYLKSQAFDGSTCLRIMENIQRGMDEASRQRLHACLKINGRRDNSAS